MRTFVLCCLFGLYILTGTLLVGVLVITYNWLWGALFVGFMLGSITKPPRYDD